MHDLVPEVCRRRSTEHSSRTCARGATSWSSSRASSSRRRARTRPATSAPWRRSSSRSCASSASTRIETAGADEERPNLLAHVGRRGGRTLILGGHLDTKPPGDLAEWARDPYGAAVEDGELHGVGSGDMKGAVAAMVFALAALEQHGLERGAVTLVLTADEEAGSRLGSQWLAESGLLAGDAAVLGEPCGIVSRVGGDRHRLARRGALQGARARHADALEHLRPAAVRERDRADGAPDRPHGPRAARPPAPAARRGSRRSTSASRRAPASSTASYPGEAEFALRHPHAARHDARAARRGPARRSCATRPTTDPELDAELDFEIWHPATEIDAGHPPRHGAARGERDRARRRAARRRVPRRDRRAALPAHGRHPDGRRVRPGLPPARARAERERAGRRDRAGGRALRARRAALRRGA